MNPLEARVECLKLAAATCGPDKSAQNVAKVATLLYDWAADGESVTPPTPSLESRNADSPSVTADARTRRKAPVK